jgi:hypothetical protein
LRTATEEAANIPLAGAKDAQECRVAKIAQRGLGAPLHGVISFKVLRSA